MDSPCLLCGQVIPRKPGGPRPAFELLVQAEAHLQGDLVIIYLAIFDSAA